MSVTCTCGWIVEPSFRNFFGNSLKNALLLGQAFVPIILCLVKFITLIYLYIQLSPDRT